MKFNKFHLKTFLVRLTFLSLGIFSDNISLRASHREGSALPTSQRGQLPANFSATDYITQWKAEAIYQMVVHKIPASITLAQGMLESGNGNSRLAEKGNNHFGIKCHNDWGGKKIHEDDETNGECFRKYTNACESFEDHSLFLKKKRYEKLFGYDADDYKKWAKGLKECGYATNSQYPDLLISLVEKHNLHEYDAQGMEYIKKGKLPAQPCGNSGNSSDGKKDETAENKSTQNKKTESKDESKTINVSSGHEIKLSENKIKFIVAKSGDTQQSIAEDLEMMEWQIRKYNDLANHEILSEGEIIYLQPKRSSGTQASYTFQEGDTLRDISQRYGIKLKKLYKLNSLLPSDRVDAGTLLKLK
ncbi:MAG: glucosaminidase domain-containing protein [Flavobacteriales bacterium]|nr:glucosaminidase domain-containing protein [Flavobacteriales bacterium]